jgi:hypothetical protein
MGFINTREYYSAIKKNGTIFYRKMDGTLGHHIKQNKSLRKQISHVFIYMWEKVKNINERGTIWKGTDMKEKGEK